MINIYRIKDKIFSFFDRTNDLVFGKRRFKKNRKNNLVLNKDRKSDKEVEGDLSIEFSWRGLHFDVSRHFFDINYLKKIILEMQKLDLNILHLHLSDDQGFRFESKKYPKLNTIGSVRRETVIDKNFPTFLKEYKGDGKKYSGYYTQNELRDLVFFAKERNITIVPEIDIPGHATAILASYPEYSLFEVPIEVATYWGIFSNILKDDDKTLKFLKDIFDELCDVFDSKYIHIGGDEVHIPKIFISPIKNKKYRHNFLLLGIARHLKSKNRIPVMWDEAHLVAKKVGGIVMVWQSLEDLSKVLKTGVQTICASSTHFYFDYYQKPDIDKEPLAIGGYTPVEKVLDSKNIIYPLTYKYNNLIGMQAQVWTEYIRNEKEADYMIFPRLNAFAEVANGIVK